MVLPEVFMNESMCSKTVTYLYECMQIGLGGTCSFATFCVFLLYVHIPNILMYFCSFPFAILSCNKKKNKNKTKREKETSETFVLVGWDSIEKMARKHETAFIFFWNNGRKESVVFCFCVAL